MKVRIRKGLSVFMTAVLLASGFSQPVSAAAAGISHANRLAEEENGVTVTTREEFMEALQQHKSPITVTGLVTIGKDVDTDNRMLPVKIPANTVIRGTENGILNSRSPIQLEGDVCFQDIELTFESTNALGSVPHREIFLAGHGLTFDNVKSWLDGGEGEFGPLGGTEKELLPTVYAGGYSNTQIGSNASLTVRNSNSKTMFQAIYMGHEAEGDNKVPYRGTATVNLDTKVTVRDRVDVSKNSQAEINIAGGEYDYANAKVYYGNENTTLTLSKSSITDATVENVGNIVVADKGCLASKTTSYGNITLQRGGCLDLNAVNDVTISGNFTGVDNQQEERGILVVNKQSTLMIEGIVTGTTQFQTDSRLFPGYFNTGWPYISAVGQNASSGNFVLSQKSTDFGYQLMYNRGTWSVGMQGEEEPKEIGSIDIISAPSEVALSRIAMKEDGTVPDENIYFELIWKDVDGNIISSDKVEEWMLYEFDYVYVIKTDYWESDEPEILEKTDWNNLIGLMVSEEHPGKYFLQAFDGAKTGNYTFLFCADNNAQVLDTVGDVKNLKDQIKAECRVAILDHDPLPTPTMAPTMKPTPTPAVTESAEPKPSAPSEEKPTMKPTPTPVVTESAEPKPSAPSDEKPTEKPTPTPVVTESAEPRPSAPSEEKPTEKPTPTPVVTESAEPRPSAPLEEKPTTSPTSMPTPPAEEKPTAEPSPIPEEKPLEHVHVYEMVFTVATVEKDGSYIKKCSCGQIESQQTVFRPAQVTLSADQFVYTGKKRVPDIKITDASGTAISSNNYDIRFQNNVKVGMASVTIIFKGDYSGQITKFFRILPKRVKITNVTQKKKGFLVKWKKQNNQITGYEIQYSTSKKFTKKATKRIIVKSNKAVSRIISSKRAGKKYYIRLRAYKTIKGNGTAKFYSKWSKAKAVTVRRK